MKINKKLYLSQLISNDKGIRKLFDKNEHMNFTHKNYFAPPVSSSTRISTTKTKTTTKASISSTVFPQESTQTTIYKIPKNISFLNNYYKTPKEKAYQKFKSMREKPFHPFYSGEKRFKWQNLKDPSNPVYIEDVKNKIRIKRMKNDSLVEGLGNYMYKQIPTENNKNSYSCRRAKSACDLEHVRNNEFIRTQRVILPENNYEKTDDYHKGLKCCFNDSYDEQQQKRLILSSGGSMESLLNRTPLKCKVSAKKKVKNISFDFHGSLNLFDGKIVPPVYNKGIRVHFKDVICKKRKVGFL